jgi:hypothetical protein
MSFDDEKPAKGAAPKLPEVSFVQLKVGAKLGGGMNTVDVVANDGPTKVFLDLPNARIIIDGRGKWRAYVPLENVATYSMVP